MVKVTGTLQASTDIMKASNALVQLPQLAGTMREMSAEMMKVRSPLSLSLSFLPTRRADAEQTRARRPAS